MQPLWNINGPPGRIQKLLRTTFCGRMLICREASAHLALAVSKTIDCLQLQKLAPVSL